MRSIVFIISIYFLFLALLPCSCNIQTIDSFQKKPKNELGLISHHENDSTHIICSSFCTCSNVHNPNFIEKNGFDLQNLYTIPVKKFPIYNENKTSAYLDSLWRPPKA